MKERLKKLRKTLDLTQQAFADKIGMKQNTIAQYEMGRTNPSDAIIFSICREFGVNEEWLRNGTGDMFVPEAVDEVDALVTKYGLSDADRILIEKYINAKSDTRNAIVNFISDVSAALDNEDLFGDVPDTPEELEKLYPPIDAKSDAG